MSGTTEPTLLEAIKNDDLNTVKLSEQLKDNPHSVLFEACKRGAIQICAYLIDNFGCSLESKDDQGNTLVHLSCHSSDIKLLKRLIKWLNTKKLDRSLPNSNGDTPLHVSCGLGKTKFVIYLISEAGFDPYEHNGEGMNILHIACKVGSVDIVQFLTRTVGMDPTTKAKDKPLNIGLQPIHLAALYGHMVIVVYLIEECGCDPHSEDNRGRNVVHLAADGGDLDLIIYLIEKHGCDPNHKTKPFNRAASGRVALHSASFQGNLEIIKYLVAQCKCDPAVKDEDGVTPLACAAQEGKLETVRFLTLECGVDPNTQDLTGRTPLHYSCLKGRSEVARYLVEEAKVDTNLLDNNGEPPVILAAKGVHEEVVHFLVHLSDCNPMNDASQSGRSVLHFAASHNWLSIVQYLVSSKRMNPELADNTGMTALHHAADGGSLEVIRFFIEERKCNCNLMSKEGDSGATPLLKACLRGKLEVVQYLIKERGCSLRASEGKLMAPIHMACSGGHINVVRFLLDETSQQVDFVDQQGAYPIHFSILNGYLSLTKLLIEQYKADPMKKTRRGATGVHAACQGGHLDLLKYLINDLKCHQSGALESGGTPLHRATEYGHLSLVRFLVEEVICVANQRDPNGRVALHFAALKGFVDIVRYLIDISCDVMVQDNSGTIPLHLACTNGHEAVIKLLLEFDGPAQVVCKDAKGQTSLQLAKQSNKITDSLLLEFLKHSENTSELVSIAPSSCDYLKSYKPLYSFGKVFIFGNYQPLLQEIQQLQRMGGGLQSTQLNMSEHFPSLSFIQPKLFGESIFYTVPSSLICGSQLLADAFTSCEHPVLVVCLNSTKHVTEITKEVHQRIHYISETMNKCCKPLLTFLLDDTDQQPHLLSVQEMLRSLKLPKHKVIALNQIIYSRIQTGQPFGAVRLFGTIGHHSNIVQPCKQVGTLTAAVRAFLKSDLMSNQLVCTLQEMSDKIYQSKVLLPKDQLELADHLTTLCHNGYIVFIRNSFNISLSWLVLDVELVTNLIFNDISNLQSYNPLGLVRHSDIVKHSSATDPSLFVSFLKYIGFCVDVTEILANQELAVTEHAKEERLYYFPHVVPPRPPAGLTLQTKANQITFGWLIMSKTSPSHFPPKFCSLLPLLMPLGVEPGLTEKRVLNGSFAFWKNGVHWVKDGIKMAVINFDDEAILILVKGKRKKQVEVCQRRLDLVMNFRKLGKSFCEEFETDDYLIHPRCLRNILFNEDLPPLDVIPVHNVEDDYKKAIKKFGCSYDDFIGFEPYFLLKDCSSYFFDKFQSKNVITQEDINGLANRFSPFSKELQKIFGFRGARNTDITAYEVLVDWVAANGPDATYFALWMKLKQYSLYGSMSG